MSRSFKKVPIIKYGDSSNGKREANKKVRHIDIGNNSNYKKVYEKNDIWGRYCNLYEYTKIDGVPTLFYGYSYRLTYDEIMKYWRK
jgi:hypothetical protein